VEPRRGEIVNTFNSNRHMRERDAATVSGAEYLAKRNIERTQARLIRRASVPTLVRLVRDFLSMHTRSMTIVRMPDGVHERTLLRDKQQDNAKILEKRAACHVNATALCRPTW
jgi:hypothetical protein